MEIQLFFSFSILPSIVLKRWKCPDILDIKGKIVAKLLWIIHFLSIYNIIKKQQINHGIIHVTCIMAFFIPLTCVTLCQFFYVTSRILSTKITKYETEKVFCVYGSSPYHLISKEVENCIFRHVHNRISFLVIIYLAAHPPLCYFWSLFLPIPPCCLLRFCVEKNFCSRKWKEWEWGLCPLPSQCLRPCFYVFLLSVLKYLIIKATTLAMKAILIQALQRKSHWKKFGRFDKRSNWKQLGEIKCIL